MDPATWSWLTCTWLIQTSIGGIVGNRLDAEATKVWTQGWQAFTQKMRGACPAPINQDLEVAVHRAFLLAQRSLVCECLEEFTGGTWTELGANKPVTPGHEKEDVDWLQRELKRIKADLKRLKQRDYAAIPEQALETSEALLSEAQGLGIGGVEEALRHQLKNVILADAAPATYQDRAITPGKGLFERTSAFFAFELKTNEKVQSLFQNQLLIQINAKLGERPLALGEIEQALEGIAQQLPDVLAWLSNVELAIQDLGSDMLAVSGRVESKADVLIEMGTDQSNDLAEIKRSLAILVSETEPQTVIQETPTLVLPQNRVREGPNPFTYGPAVLPERFYGRSRNRTDIKNRIGSIAPQSINIVGLRRNGKSSILRYIQERIHEFCAPEQQPLVVLLDLQDRRFHQPEGILEGIRRGISKQLGREPWNKESNDDPFAIEDELESLRNQGYRLIVMFDEFEAIGKRLEVFHDWGDDWRAKASSGLVTMVIASRLEVSQLYDRLQLTSPFGNIFSTTLLGALEVEAWQQLLQDGNLGEHEMQWVYDMAGHLPYYTQLAAWSIWRHGKADLAQQEFLRQAKPRLTELWQELGGQEQQVLKQGLASSLSQQNLGIGESLKAYGLLHPNGELFTAVFTNFVRQQS